MGTLHKSLRLEESLIERVENLKADNESLSKTFVRVLQIGCDVLESDTDGAQRGTVAQGDTDGAQIDAQGGAQGKDKLIEHLEHEIERLEAEHEADRAAIAAKDEQIARALEKAHELTEQAHVLMGMQHQAEALPSPGAQDEHEETQADAEPKKGFWRELFGL